jgi:hypothetical protein
MTWLESLLVAVLPFLLTALGGLGVWIVKLHRQRRADQQEDRADVWTRQSVLIDRQDKQLAAVQAEQSRALVAEMACREEVARLRATGQWQQVVIRSLHAALERAGLNPEPLPDFADFAGVPKTTHAEKEFVQRTLEHRTALLRQEVREGTPLLPPHAPDPPGAAAGPGPDPAAGGGPS